MFQYTSNAYKIKKTFKRELVSVFNVDRSQIEFQLGRLALYIPIRVLHTSEMYQVWHPVGQRPSVTPHIDWSLQCPQVSLQLTP